MGVYLIKNPLTNIYKIGKTSDLEARLAQLQTGNSVKLEVLCFIVTESDSELEQALHLKYATVRQSGEWFALSDAQIAEIMEIGADPFFILNRPKQATNKSPKRRKFTW